MAAPNPVPKWSVDETIAFLGNIGLPHLGDAFRENAVSGSDLIDLSDADFKESLGCTPLQVRPCKAMPTSLLFAPFVRASEFNFRIRNYLGQKDSQGTRSMGHSQPCRCHRGCS